MKSPKVRSSSKFQRIVLVATIVGFRAIGTAQQHTQSIYLPDPTPRPPDLQREYGRDDRLERAKQEQAAKLRNALKIQQVVSATNALTVLAQELKTEVDKHNSGAPMAA